MRGILFCIFILGTNAYARLGLSVPNEGHSDSLYQKTDFFPRDVVIATKSIVNVEPVADATFKFTFKLDDEKAKCSGFFTSNRAHFMSAKHCFHDCLVANGFFKRLPDGLSVRTDKPYPAECRIKHFKDHRTKTVKIYSGGNCEVDGMYNRECTGDNDFVLGQIENSKSKCVKVRTTAPEIHEPIVLVGFPSATEARKDNSDGEQLYFSLGRVMPNEETKCRKATIRGGERVKSRLPEGSAGPSVPGLQRISADMVKGNSGGPIVDFNGQAIGIASSVTGFSIYLKREAGIEMMCEGGAHMVPMNAILEKSKPQLSAEQFVQFTDCTIEQ